MKRAAHGAPKAKGRSYSPLSLFVAQHGEHGAHGSHSERTSSHISRTSRGDHGLHGARSYQTNRNSERLTALSASNGAVVEVSDAVAERLQEIMPQSRREIRLSRLANERRRRLLVSTSMIAMIGAVAATMSLTKINTFDSRAAELESGITSVDDSSALNVSRSSQRTSLDSPDPMDAINNAVDSIENASGSDSGDASHAAHAVHAAHAARADYDANTNNSGAYASSGISGLLGISTARSAASSHPGTASVTSSKSDSWKLGADSGFNIAEMSRSAADNPKVALLMDKDFDVLPKGFNPNHATGDTGNAYEFSQCTWWVYVRRSQLGLPVGSHFGNGNMWADSARGLGYWVDRTPRHVGDIMVFRAGQAGSDPFYGHVAIVEKINPDGSIETSESGASLRGKTFSRKFDAKQLSQYQFIHY
ncbi:amidase [Gardnerella vaginalis]|uniref:Amidase n=1 Tax=Gardnerella vaginalis TaxID=2702 RepID=A0A3E1INU0_GARVA|nr:CHAP domain-containing protein [Gardnerella vaginalis]RFD74666.1 amidase [Gardnerella vaginalis]